MYGANSYGTPEYGIADKSKVATTTLSETINVSASLFKSLGRSVSDSVVATASVIRKTTKIFSDTLVMSIIQRAIITIWYVPVETINFSEAIAKKTIRTIVENISLTILFLKVATLKRSLSESVRIASSISRSLVRNISEAVRIVEGFVKSWTIGRTVTDSISFAVTFARKATLIRILPETIRVSEICIVSIKEILTKAIGHIKTFARIRLYKNNAKINKTGEKPKINKIKI